MFYCKTAKIISKVRGIYGKYNPDFKIIILENQTSAGTQNYYPRRMKVERISGKATIITGVRRCGKSVYKSINIIELLTSGTDRTSLCIIDFSDDRLTDLRNGYPGFVSDAYYELFPEKADEKVWFFFDSGQDHMSLEMISNVTGYLEDTYLIFTVEIFNVNVFVRKTNPKKIYVVDHSVATAMSGRLTNDHGKILENIVFMYLVEIF